MRLSLIYISPPIAVLFCGKPISMFLTPPWWAMPLPLLALLSYGAGSAHIAVILMIIWGWPGEKSKEFALLQVQNSLEDNRFKKIRNVPKAQPRLRLVKPPPPTSCDMGDDVGIGGTSFRAKRKRW
jgi:hypothetical protein